MTVSSGTSAKLCKTNRATGLAEMHLQMNAMVCGKVARDVQLGESSVPSESVMLQKQLITYKHRRYYRVLRYIVPLTPNSTAMKEIKPAFIESQVEANPVSRPVSPERSSMATHPSSIRTSVSVITAVSGRYGVAMSDLQNFGTAVEESILIKSLGINWRIARAETNGIFEQRRTFTRQHCFIDDRGAFYQQHVTSYSAVLFCAIFSARIVSLDTPIPLLYIEPKVPLPIQRPRAPISP